MGPAGLHPRIIDRRNRCADSAAAPLKLLVLGVNHFGVDPRRIAFIPPKPNSLLEAARAPLARSGLGAARKPIFAIEAVSGDPRNAGGVLGPAELHSWIIESYPDSRYNHLPAVPTAFSSSGIGSPTFATFAPCRHHGEYWRPSPNLANERDTCETSGPCWEV